MYVYGEKWHRALHTILKRLALDEGYGFLVLEGPNGSGKSDMIRTVGRITQSPSTIKKLRDEETRKLAELTYARRYITIDLGKDNQYWTSIPVSILGRLLKTIHHKGVVPEQRFLLTWDDLDKQLIESNWYSDVNRRFLEDMHRPLELYRHLTFLISVTCEAGGGKEILGISAGPKHFLQL